MNGWINIWKQRDTVCTRVDRAVKRWLGGGIKVGHAGTLDPFAEGVLPIAFGHATRLVPFILNFPKTYHFTCVWGIDTDTQDPTGSIISKSSVRPSYTSIKQALSKFLGVSFQKPCKYSAVKVNGIPAYTLAREGRVFDLPEKLINIHRLDLITSESNYDGENIEIEMVCDSGTYVRAFAKDLAENLSTLAYVSKLTRTSVGPFQGNQSISVCTLTKNMIDHAQQFIYPTDYGLKFPVIVVNEVQKTQLWNGRQVFLDLPFFSDFWVCKYQEKMICLAKGVAGGVVPYRCFVDSAHK
ncbi:tRNA pseudouridine synthase B [Holospora obtusa F1]|uniref:tRNA pseudouridine synthase B n=1 Tax=Holospora obtusa F1 TaxID=1399147 RepID=W6TED2_HOLOB|nr:tRNA pseudouridine(55) synthase TruB [Holospora obtusa]ETZ07553.1 tRNA pseudouridine synthase B [Holospora obtusa F1]